MEEPTGAATEEAYSERSMASSCNRPLTRGTVWKETRQNKHKERHRRGRGGKRRQKGPKKDMRECGGGRGGRQRGGLAVEGTVCVGELTR